MSRCSLSCGLVLAYVALQAGTVFAQVGGNAGIHDPSQIIKEGSAYHVYATGPGISQKFARDLHNWVDRPSVFSSAPAWIAGEVPANTGTYWAPEIVKYNNQYRLYYSVSSFGSQDSAIGMATNNTLSTTDPNYHWIDQGLVVDSEVGYAYNAIDPSILTDQATNRMWMTFGSFWNGIYVTELNPSTGKPINASPSAATNIARNTADSADAIEASYLYQRDGYYYLFVNWGSCCQGVNSTYQVRVGRSTSPTGPFLGRIGSTSMRNGGGSVFLGTEGTFIGPGHIGIYSEGGVDYFGYHFYNANHNGAPEYNVETLAWTADGWPIPATDLMPGDFNGDLVVNATDLGVWESFYGTTTDGQDFLDWQAHVRALRSSTAVPEPSTVILIAFGSILTLTARSRRRNSWG